MQKRNSLALLLAATFGVAAAAFCSATLPCHAQAAPAPVKRAMWVWYTKGIRTDPGTQADFFHFIAAPKGDASHAVGTLFFDGVDAPDFSDPATVKNIRAFLTAAHAKGLRVDYLVGEPDWATPAKESEGIATLKAMLKFNQGGAAGQRYDGIQYDVEPYALPGWDKNQVAIEGGTVDLYSKCQAAIKASGQRVILSAAIPRWYGNVNGHDFSSPIIDHTDEVDVMDYVTTVQQLVGDPAAILAHANQVHKKVWIGVETLELKDTPRTTFFGSGNAALENVLATALPQFKQQPSFVGYAIHHWVSYEALKP